MKFDLDTIIFIGFLASNLLIGLQYGKGLKNIKDYALGGRNFSTGTIAATIIATWIGAGFFAWNLSKAYSDGLPFMVAVLGNGIALGILGYFYSPRVSEFLGCSSVAEAMGSLYGKHVRMITALSAICLAIGYTGLQIKVMSNLLNWALGLNGFYATILSTCVVVIYSTFGGIRSVTFTDIIQLFTFGAFVPGLAMLIWGSFDNPEMIINTVNNNPLFDYHPIFTLSWLTLFLWFVFPDLDPALFQRILIAKNVKQVRKAFMIASLGCVSIISITSLIGLLVLAKNQTLDPENIINYIMTNYSYVGIRGMTMAGICAMVMSTVDSYINSASVLFANDICGSLGIRVKDTAKGLILSRFFAVFAGLAALIIALLSDSFFELTLTTTSFYMPIVTVPLTLSIFGFRSTSKSVLIGIAAGVITLIMWKIYLSDTGINNVIPAMLANLTCLVGSHYLLKQKGGWVGIKNPEPLYLIRAERKKKIRDFIKDLVNFNLLAFLRHNTPKHEYAYSYFAIFSIVSIFSTIYTLPQITRHNHAEILDFIYHSVLISSTIFLTYPIWPKTLKNDIFISVTWNIAIYYNLVFISTLLICISNFNQFQIMIFVLNIFVITTFIRQKTALLMVLLCSILSLQFYRFYLSDGIVITGIDSLQFKIMYSLLLVSSVLIAFLRPQQRYQEQIEQKTDYLEDKVKDQRIELSRLQAVKNEFLRNLEHEAHTPITGITSMGQILWEEYDRLSEEQRRMGLRDIAQSAERLTSLVNNLIDISKLETINYRLNRTSVNLSDLVQMRLGICQKLFATEKNKDNLSFELKIEDGIIASCDEYYISRTMDNIIINAIQYCKEGKITIILKQLGNDQIEFAVKDEGIGIPKEELFDIFEPFTLGSRTKTPAGGRGIGLALCKKVIEAHDGKISAESNIVQGANGAKEAKGAIFKFVLAKD